MNYLIKRDIELINKEMTLKFGGLFVSTTNNLRNENSLDYVVEAVRGSLFCQEIHPTIFDKAAAYLFFIIRDHVFNDGNKRTGMESAFMFLEKNGLSIREDLDSSEIVEVAEKIAAGQLELEEIADWLRESSLSR